MRRQGAEVNHKKVYRLYRETGLSVRKRKPRKGVMDERQPQALPDAPNYFMMNLLANGRRIKCLTTVDDVTRECLDIHVAMGISGEHMVHDTGWHRRLQRLPESRKNRPGAGIHRQST